MKNQSNTILLLTTLSGLFLGVGYFIGGQSGVAYAIILSLVMNCGAYWFSDNLVLAMPRTQRIGFVNLSGVSEVVQKLCLQAKLSMPRVCVVPERSTNAFATGRLPRHFKRFEPQGLIG